MRSRPLRARELKLDNRADIRKRLSPHTWGCSELTVEWESEADVFPTHVGMFRATQSLIRLA